jgi:hypothetical protein
MAEPTPTLEDLTGALTAAVDGFIAAVTVLADTAVAFVNVTLDALGLPDEHHQPVRGELRHVGRLNDLLDPERDDDYVSGSQPDDDDDQL